jgi:hypothetical protein
MCLALCIFFGRHTVGKLLVHESLERCQVSQESPQPHARLGFNEGVYFFVACSRDGNAEATVNVGVTDATVVNAGKEGVVN